MLTFRKNYLDFLQLFLTNNLFFQIHLILRKFLLSKNYQMIDAIHHLEEKLKNQKKNWLLVHSFLNAKLINLQRDPRCSLMVAQEDWWGYVVLEGRAELLSPETTDAVELRETLRDVYRVASGTEHSNWQEYDAAMLEQRRSAVIIVPEHIYGTGA